MTAKIASLLFVILFIVISLSAHELIRDEVQLTMKPENIELRPDHQAIYVKSRYTRIRPESEGKIYDIFYTDVDVTFYDGDTNEILAQPATLFKTYDPGYGTALPDVINHRFRVREFGYDFTDRAHIKMRVKMKSWFGTHPDEPWRKEITKSWKYDDS